LKLKPAIGDAGRLSHFRSTILRLAAFLACQWVTDRAGCSAAAVLEGKAKMAVSEEQTPARRHGYSAAEKLMIIAPLLPQNRPHNSAACSPFQQRDRGRFLAAVTGPEQRQLLSAVARRIAGEHGLAASTIRKWLSCYKNGGHAALARTRRKDIGRSSYFSRYPDQKQLVEDHLLAGQKPSSITRYLRLLFRAGYTASSPSYTTVRQYAKRIAVESLSRAVPGSGAPL
jgi:hypothetical protein